jgi:hypothetical protein
MPKRDITFEIIRLLSQQIVSDSKKYPEGQLLQKTSCMNPEDAEMIGLLEASKVFLDEKEDKDIIALIDQTIAFVEKIGLSRWIKGELTHLGFRAGLKYHENIDVLEEQAIDEADVYRGAEE